MKTFLTPGRAHHIFAMLLLLSVYCVSCKKMDLHQNHLSENETTDKVNAWLEKQKDSASIAGAAKIQSLKESLDFSSQTTVLFGNDETVIVIPINETFTASSNADKHPVNSLVLFVNEKNQIRKGNIVQYISSKALSSRRVLVDFFNRYYSFKITDFTGSLVYLTITDEIAYELNYVKGDVNYYKVIGKKQQGALTETCYELGYYYYWSDGSVTWEPIGDTATAVNP